MSTRTAVALRHLVLATVLVAIAVWLWSLGSGELTTPPTSLDAVGAWVDRHDSVTLAFAVVRLEALAFAGYLVALTTASAAVRLLQLPRATRLVERLTLPVLRGMFGGAAALGVIAVPAHVHRPAQSATTTTAVSTPADDPDAHATLHLEGAEAAPPAPAPPLPSAPETEPAVPPAETWVVQPGDSLWSIAASHLDDVGGKPATDADVLVMWRRLIDLNRDRLVNPDDPDLIFADQVFELPAMETG